MVYKNTQGGGGRAGGPKVYYDTWHFHHDKAKHLTR